jgi:hypothetical protein
MLSLLSFGLTANIREDKDGVGSALIRCDRSEIRTALLSLFGLSVDRVRILVESRRRTTASGDKDVSSCSLVSG